MTSSSMTSYGAAQNDQPPMVPPAQDSQHLYDDTQYSPDEAAPLLSPKRDTALSMAVFKREGKVLGRMAWPVSAGYLMQNSISLAAVFSVGHLGTKELAAVALATMFCNVTGYSIGIGMGSALDTLCSQAHTGSPDPHALGKHLQRAIVVMFFLCFPIASLWFFAEPFLLLVGQEPEIADLSGKFARISILGLFPYLTNEAMKRYLQCQGIMKANMFIICIASPFNIFLQWLLVWSPIAIGVLGAPVATCITFCSLPIMTGLYIKFVEGGHAWGGWEWKEALDWPQIWTFIKLGIPGVAMTCTEWWAFEVVALAAGWLDGQSLASQSIVLNTATLTYMMPLGIAVASSTRIGNALGASLPGIARCVSVAALTLGLSVALINCSTLLLVRKQWGWLWSDDAEVVGLVASVLPLVAVFQISDAIGAVGGGVLRGCGRQELGAYINLAGYYILGIPLGLFLCFRQHMGLLGLWVGLTSGVVTVSIIEVVLILRIKWEQEAQRAVERVAGGVDGLHDV